MKNLFRTLITLIILSTASAFAEEVKTEAPKADAVSASTAPGATYVMCKNKNIVRTVRVMKKDGGGCATTYTKEGVDKVVSESQWGKGCEKVLNNIRENLEKASWKCKDISDARVSITND